MTERGGGTRIVGRGRGMFRTTICSFCSDESYIQSGSVDIGSLVVGLEPPAFLISKNTLGQ